MKKNWLKKKSVYIPLLIVAVIIIFAFYRSRGKTAAVSIAAVTRGVITQEVTVTGSVKSKEAVDLAFEKTGKVRLVNADIGSKVSAGDLLVALENGVENSALEDARAKLKSAQAHYDDLNAGGRAEEISVKQSGLDKAKSDLTADYGAVQNIISDSFNKADNAVRRQADTLFSNTLSSNPQLSFTSNDQQAVFDAQSGRYTVESVLNNFKKLSQSDFTADTYKESGLAQTKSYLEIVNDFLIKTNRALNAAISLSDTVLATDKDALNTARTNINTALTNVTEQIQTIATQKITVQTAADNLALTKAPATAEVLAGAQADIDSAAANVKNMQAVLAKTYIVSPISGIVTKQDAKQGEIAGANTAVVSVASENFKIEAFVPEADVAKISVSDSATITLDAYGNDVSFDAHIVKIDPAETVIDGVSTYKTTLEFDKNDERIRSGMTANTTITSATKTNVLSITQRSGDASDGKKFVTVILPGGKTEEREVAVGLKGADGSVEILSGLSEGEKVANQAK